MHHDDGIHKDTKGKLMESEWLYCTALILSSVLWLWLRKDVKRRKGEKRILTS